MDCGFGNSSCAFSIEDITSWAVVGDFVATRARHLGFERALFPICGWLGDHVDALHKHCVPGSQNYDCGGPGAALDVVLWDNVSENLFHNACSITLSGNIVFLPSKLQCAMLGVLAILVSQGQYALRMRHGEKKATAARPVSEHGILLVTCSDESDVVSLEARETR